MSNVLYTGITFMEFSQYITYYNDFTFFHVLYYNIVMVIDYKMSMLLTPASNEPRIYVFLE